MRSFAPLMLVLALLAAVAIASPASRVTMKTQEINRNQATAQLQSAFAIPCDVCIAIVTEIETAGENDCVAILTKACSALKFNCSDFVKTLACGIVKELLQKENPTTVCTNTVHCTNPAANNAFVL